MKLLVTTNASKWEIFFPFFFKGNKNYYNYHSSHFSHIHCLYKLSCRHQYTKPTILLVRIENYTTGACDFEKGHGMCGYRNIIAKNTFNWTFGGRNVNGYRWPKTDHTTEFSTGKGMMCDTVVYEVHVFIHSALFSVSFSMSFWVFFVLI